MIAARGSDDHGVTGGAAPHVPVLIEEVIEHLAPMAGETFIDGTFGAGGYTGRILDTGASVIAIDRDPTALEAGQSMVAASDGRLTLVEGRFSDLDQLAADQGHEKVDGVVLDVGVSSMQLDRAERGFSFRQDGPLDMRMGGDGPTASDVVNTMEPRDLARVIAVLGEERKARLVVAAIMRARADRAITTTGELAEIVSRAIGRQKFGEIHPATRTFQALRIFVNRELDELADALAASERVLAEGGRLVVVAFHSLEDRIVKRFLADRSAERAGGSRHMPEAQLEPPTFTLLTRGTVSPGEAEVDSNPRARSARLRAARRTAAPSRALDKTAIGVPDLPSFSIGRPS
ncbi:16S rRNA (cytosine(1402)-N(4))-methyltransferase RsmH [Bauldia litoralis]|uniref:Ribosomal RNA small subunit methyltransferase H n=1 Tax=Bauldia litoralis TaxID=665467 RepID=A0A1G6D323_9HYPH|nr:16S rRNA (cytosine(1402)-N(4))-methyltransferase RsmH [Bauldia litoralis]SDB39573.1 16S rRNA (cytosine1402-N4)-methyltransferase [Bauldia litoralis]